MSGIVGVAVGAVLASPLIALLASPAASADTTDATGPSGDIATYGPYTFDGYTDTFSINTTTDAFDNTLTYDGTLLTGLELDFYSPATDTYDLVVTDPGFLQLGIVDTDGVFSFTDSFTPPFDADPGLADIAGAVSADAVAGLSF